VNAINSAFGGTAVNAVSGEDGTGCTRHRPTAEPCTHRPAGSQETLLVTSRHERRCRRRGRHVRLRRQWFGEGTARRHQRQQPARRHRHGRGTDPRQRRQPLGERGHQQLAQARGPGTAAGAFHPITPVRLYDSRPSKGGGGPIATGEDRTLSVAQRADDRTDRSEGAQAISYTLTVTGTAGTNGYLSVTEGGTVGFTVSTINWSTPGTTIANSSVVKDRRQRPGEGVLRRPDRCADQLHHRHTRLLPLSGQCRAGGDVSARLHGHEQRCAMSSGEQPIDQPEVATWRLAEATDVPFVYRLGHTDRSPLVPVLAPRPRTQRNRSSIMGSIAAGAIVQDAAGQPRCLRHPRPTSSESGTGTFEYYALPTAHAQQCATQAGIRTAGRSVRRQLAAPALRRAVRERPACCWATQAHLFTTEVVLPDFLQHRRGLRNARHSGPHR
jgi:hypothetical protein